MDRAVILLSILAYATSVSAEETPPLPTRWFSPDGASRPVHQAPQASSPLRLIARPAPQALQTVPPPAVSNPGRICIVVADSVYDAVSARLDRFVSDLQRVGFSPIVYRYVSGTPEELRDYLRTLYQEPESLIGAELVGNIPYIIYEMNQDWDGPGGDPPEYEDFPCDIFYGDLDGVWEDVLDDGLVRAGNGKYDTRSGNIDLEIWVCRLRTSSLSALGSETDLLNSYFDKNHAYRTCALRTAPEALVYDDDDWSTSGASDASAVGQVYSTVTEVSDPEATTASDYKTARLPEDRELVFTRSHGNPNSHAYYRNGGATYDWVYSTDYPVIDPPALFYSLYVCSGCDYTAPGNIGGMIVFNPASGLLAWGSTKTGGMTSDYFWYSELSGGGTFGDAFKAWYNQVNDYSYAPRYFLGMVIIGDAALQPSPVRTELFVDVPASAQEGDGLLADQGVVYIPAPRDSDISVTLQSSDTAEVQVPASVTVPAGSVSATFDLFIINDGVPDPDATVSITASLDGWSPGTDEIVVRNIQADTAPPSVSLAEAVLAGTVHDAYGDPPFVLVDGMETPVSGGVWTGEPVSVSPDRTVTVEAEDASSNQSRIRVSFATQ